MSKFRFFMMDHSRGLWSIFFAKFLEILTTGSLENGTFLLKQSVSIFDSMQIQVVTLFICCSTLFCLIDSEECGWRLKWSDTLKAKQDFLITSLFNSVWGILWLSWKHTQKKTNCQWQNNTGKMSWWKVCFQMLWWKRTNALTSFSQAFDCLLISGW